MKKMIWLLVFSSMLLVSCTGDPVKDIVEEEPEDVSSVYSEYDKPYAFKIDGELPDIGEFSGISNYGSYHDKPEYGFIPGNYGERLLPYVGSVKDFGYMKCSSYGFCDESGKIVMDASYDYSSVTEHYDDDGNMMYSLNVNMTKDEYYDDAFLAGGTILVDGKGRWALALERGWVNYMKDGIISVSVMTDYESYTMKEMFLDYDGCELYEIDGYTMSGGGNAGLYLVADWNNDDSRYIYKNRDGEAVLGPYSEAENFNEHGIAAVLDYDGKAYLIDTEGNKLTDKYYSRYCVRSSDDGEKSVFVFDRTDANNLLDIYNSDGTFAGEAYGDEPYSITVKFPDNGELIYFTQYYNGGGCVWRRLSDNSFFKSKDFEKMPNSYAGDDNSYLYLDEENHIGYVIDSDGNTAAVMEDFHDYSFTRTKDGRFVLYNSGEYNYDYNHETMETTITDTRKFHIYDTEKEKIVYTGSSAGYPDFAGNDERYVLIRHVTERDVMSYDESYTLYDIQAGEVIFENCPYIEADVYFGDWYYNVCTENTSTLYDADFGVIRKSYYE